MNNGKEKKININIPDAVRLLLGIFALYMTVVAGISFNNAANSYEQAVAFRLFAIGLALALTVVSFEPTRLTFIAAAVWVPVGYVFTHYAYEYRWIPDTCEYQFVDVIRMSKALILMWGFAGITFFGSLKKRNDFAVPAAKPGRILALIWIAWIALITACNMGYLYTALFAAGYTFMFLALGSGKNREIFKEAFLWGMICSFIFVTFKSLLHRPYDEERYLLYFYNANNAGEYLATVAMVIVAKLESAMLMKKGKLRNAALIAFSALLVWEFILAFLNNTRTGIVPSVAALLVFFVLKLKGSSEKKKVVFRFILIPLITLVLLYPGYLLVRYIPAYSNSPEFFTWEENPEVRVVKDDPADSPKYTSFTGLLREMFGKWGILIDFGDENVRADGSEQTSTLEIDDKDVSNGRMTVWKEFISRTGVEPHYPGHIIVGEDWLIYHAHNSYLQVAYQYGFFAGLILLLMCGFAALYAIYLYCTGREERKPVFSLLICITVPLSMMTEWMGHPCYVICFALFVGMGLLMYENGKK
ncbi:MAG: hypothetical protein K6C99_10015 [Lachnospiraceae bacterium]|nr:hypothetical protein [Lachnospiraceae bacterium]